jgi:hypothetical protein
MDFFQLVFFQLGNDYPVIRAPRAKAASWWSFAAGPFGYYSLTFSRQGYRVEIYLDTGHKDTTKALFDQLRARRADLTHRLGFEVDWERLDNNRGSRIACYYDGPLDPQHSDEATLDAAACWSAARVQALHSTLDAELRNLARQV